MAGSVVRVAVVQTSSVLFDREGSAEKVARLTAKAGREGARLVLFPEALIPGYPRGLSFGTVVGARSAEGRGLWERYWNNSVAVPGPVTAQLGKTAKEAGVFLAVGVVERDTDTSGGTLFCTVLYFGPDGRLLGKHRKLKPTAAERLIWGEGDGSTLTVLDTELGKIGGLICWENYMPMARMALYAKGVEFYLAPTADGRETWIPTLRHIAMEGRCFVLGCNQFVTKSVYPEELRGELAALPEIVCRGGSAIVSPLGEVLAGPLWDEEGMLFADLDRAELTRARFDFDVVGHYARPDVFELRVEERAKRAVREAEE
jgi:nitrilase